MGIVKELTLLPVAPLRFTLWVAARVAEQVDTERSSPPALAQRLREIEAAHGRGEIGEDEAAELEARVIEQAGDGYGRHA
jgi:Gas vesicle protein G